MAVANIDDDDDENVLKQLDAPVSTIPDVETAKARIVALLEVQQRDSDYQTRLERKLLSLDTALAQQRNEVESLQRTLQLEQQKDAADASSRRIEREQKTQKQEERIRNCLSDVLYRKAPPRSTKKKDQVFELDTVLISFIRPNDSVRYNLPFRVDNTTTLKHLRDDACKYWDVSTEDFILKTMGNSKCQNEIMVQDCFKQGEIAQLRLEYKNKEQMQVTEAEYKAIAPRNPKARTRSNKDKANMGADSVLKFNDKFSSTLKKMGGIYFLLKLRDLKPSEHCSKIKPRDWFMYSFLAVLTVILYVSQRRAGEAYWMQAGIEHALFTSVPKPSFDPHLETSANVPSFRDLHKYDDVWDWLQVSLPYILWRNTSFVDQSINTYNILKGYVYIRQKTLQDPSPSWQNCDKFEKEVAALGASCPSAKIQQDNEQTGATYYEGVKRYWDYYLDLQKDTDFIRGPALPWKFVTADDNHKNHRVPSISGKFQSYDAGGYGVEYRASLPTKAPDRNLEFYDKDMKQFRHTNWISNLTTRAVFVSFNIYNQDYDLWSAVQLTIEMPPSGLIVTTATILPYVPNLWETSSEYMMAYALILRLLIGGYIAFIVAPTEMKHKTRNQKAGYLYLASLNGVCDVLIVACIFTSVLFRYLDFRDYKTQDLMVELADAPRTKGFLCFFALAHKYEWLFLIESLIFCFTMYRMISLFRLNRTVYLLWHTIGNMCKETGLHLALLFIPTFWFFTIAAHRIWGRTVPEFESLQDSFISVYHMTKGHLNINGIVALDTVLAAVYYGMLYLFLTFLLVTGFSMVFVEAYYVVQLTATSQGEHWGYKDANKWKNWLIHPMFLSCFHYATSGSSSAPSSDAGAQT